MTGQPAGGGQPADGASVGSGRSGGLAACHDAFLFDLDGTLYRGPVAVDGAVRAVRALCDAGRRVAYLTNNASRSPQEVAAHLSELGYPARAAEVATSSQAAASMLAERLDPGSAVLVVGTDALAAEIAQVGLRPVRRAQDSPAAVVQGHSPDTGWPILAEAALALRAGAAWVATNVDPTLPTDRGLLPGNGSMVAALATATGRTPDVAGKPARRLMDEAVARLGAERPLTIGDRLDTDIAGAHAAGLPSLLVLTGVATPAELLSAAAEHRPDYLAADLAGLADDPARLRPGPQPGWRVTGDEAGLRLAAEHRNAQEHGTGGADEAGSALQALRALCGHAWSRPAIRRPGAVHAADDTAARALRALGL